MNKRWKTWFFVLSCILSTSANAVDLSSTPIVLILPILPSSCKVETNKDNISVSLGTFGNNSLTSVGKVFGGGTFVLSLVDCNKGIIGTVVTLSGTADPDTPGLLRLSNPDSVDTAKGVAVLIKDDADNIIPINSKTALLPLQEGSNKFTFKVAYQVTQVPVDAGKADAVLYLDMAYQ
ncbi:MAG: fimbrial protein [Hafnia alvei]|uniref:fimbrial protein n=1 Tax=Hafnia alvei TaxID=569 RepID=UPI00103362C9|nr:fimbrial protein [Hafnia alvei]KAA0261286.1 type 1 fimbrial protein [Hafnia alvei]TBL83629.1 type 1 fimbrial protein [Hafnia alvei]